MLSRPLLGPTLLALSLMVVPTNFARADVATRQAKRHFKKGQTLYQLGEFDRALSQYSKAYEIKPFAELLFNIGQCHRHLHRYERALFMYRSYLRAKPKAANRTTVQELIAEVQKAYDRQRASGAQPTKASPVVGARKISGVGKSTPKETFRSSSGGRAKSGASATDIRATRVQGSAASASHPAVTPPGEDLPNVSAPVYERWWFWTIVGAAVVGAAGGAAVLLTRDSELPTGTLGRLDDRPGQ